MKIIPEYPRYSATEDGRIWDNKKNRFIKLCLSQDGYVRGHINADGKDKNFRIHRLIAMAYLPKIDGKNLVNHKDLNKANNNVNNLEWCTCSENMKHAFINNKKYKKSTIKAQKLGTLSIVKHSANFCKALKILNSNGYSYNKLMKLFNISSKGTISYIINNR